MSQAQPAPTIAEPFPGPRPFAPGESDIFQGRERESRDVRDLVLAYQVVVFHSHSGSGKTSLVNAGLLPLLAGEGIDPYPTARVGGQVPQGLDVSQIRNIYAFDALSTCLGSSLDPKTALQMGLDEALLAKAPSAPRLLILDQFEELFTNHPERWEDRKPFVQQVSRLCEADKDLRVLIVIRDDHLAELDTYAEMLPYSLRIRYRLERLREDSALKAIKVPLRMAGYEFEATVAEDLVANLRKVHVQTGAGVQEIAGEFVEPVHLQVVCQNLWKNRPKEKRAFSADDVKRFADVNQALRSFYDQAIGVTARKAQVSEKKLRNWFDTELITSDGTRGLVHRGKDQTEGVPNSAVEALEQEHVIRAEPRAGGLWYEITHDRFIQPIRESNRTWIARRRRLLALSAPIFLLAVFIPALVISHRRQQQEARSEKLAKAQFEQAEKEVRQARDAEAANQLGEALKHYKAALDLYTSLANPAGQADTEFKLGSAYFNLHQMTDSEPHYQRAYELHKAEGNWKAAAQDEAAVGDIRFQEGPLDKAVQAYTESLALQREHGSTDLLSKGKVLKAMGWAYWQLGDYAHALDYLQEARDTLDKLDQQFPRGILVSQSPADDDSARRAVDTIRQKADASLGIGAIYFSQGRYEDGIVNFNLALRQFRSSGQVDAIAMATADLGYGYLLEQNYDKALSLLKEAEAINQQGAIPAPWVEEVVLADESVVYIEQGNSLGLKTADKALAFARSQQDLRWTGICLWVEAFAYLHFGELDKSEDAARQALVILRQLGEKEMESRALDTLGLLAEARHDRKQAVEYCRKAVEINAAIGNENLFAKRARKDLDRLTRGDPDTH